MLFTSTIFLYAFLPVVLIAVYTFSRFSSFHRLLIPFLILASFVFYGYQNINNIPLLLLSIGVNYAISLQLGSRHGKALLIAGIIFNLALLTWFKYTNFILENYNALFTGDASLLDIVLPLAISFYTFQQIAYLVDAYKGLVKDSSFKNYLLFVSFFPQLIIGPIVHHSEMMPQFAKTGFGRFKHDNFIPGALYLFSGLVKKIILSDQCAQIVDSVHAGVADGAAINFADAWLSAFAFSFQIYFDFSGYTDMAVGIALMVGIRLPFNFDSPYKSASVSDFWRRWHMTLSRWLRDYLYIPLGGNSGGALSASRNALIVFVLGGLWHGASWNFVLWGLFQGVGMAINNLTGGRTLLPFRPLAVALTFLFITLSWVLFRSVDVPSALSLYGSMLSFGSFAPDIASGFSNALTILLLCTVIVFLLPNTHQAIPVIHGYCRKLPLPAVYVFLLLIWICFSALDLDSSAEFIYFDF